MPQGQRGSVLVGLALKEILALRYEQTKRLAPAISLIIQAATLSTVVYGLISWRGVGPWILPAIFLAVVFFGVGASWAYYDLLDMRRYERAALMNLDPMQQDQLTPKEAKTLALLHDALRRIPGSDEALTIAIRNRRLK